MNAELQERLEQAERRVEALEELLETRTRELNDSHREGRSQAEYLEEVHRLVPCALVLVGSDGVIRKVNRRALELLGYVDDGLTGQPFEAVVGILPDPGPDASGRAEGREHDWTTADGGKRRVVAMRSRVGDGTDEQIDVIVGLDLREPERREIELRHAQKMESMGRLAAGVAHEINTPMQFIGDNVTFLREAFDDLLKLIEAYERLGESVADRVPPEVMTAAREAAEAADLEFLRERGPGAFEHTLDGVSRVAGIIAAMKAFAHPSDEMAPADLNELIATTLHVAKSEYRYVAEVVADLGPLPPVVCRRGDISQVVLNLLVNATHAVADASGERGKGQGRIVIRTRDEEDGWVILSVSDTGTGIPEDVRGRIFEPFFTTKDVGRGTGQGLSIVYAVVERHGGSIAFETEHGRGTTFHVRLPVEGADDELEHVA